MKVLNICVNGVYSDGFSYHENLLPKYHKKNGHDTYIMASAFAFNQNGQIVRDNRSEYVDENGVHIYRLKTVGDKDISYRFKRFIAFREILEKIQPDIIFCHLFQFLDVDVVIKYKKKHPSVKLYFDSHSDYSNSAKNWLSKNIQHKLIWRYFAKKGLPYAEKFYGVLPARVDFIKELYGIPEEKVELLVMGADDEFVQEASKSEVKRFIREKLNIDEDDFVLINGGKIDQWKKQTLLLMDAVNEMNEPKVKLIVFGSVTPDLKDEVYKHCSERVQYIGWIDSKDSYQYFAASDLAVFPGRHSVFWEQVAGQGIPMVVKLWEGTTHVDQGGNVLFLHIDSVAEIRNRIMEARENYNTMCRTAKKAKDTFSYAEIAKKSIEFKE